METEQSGQNSPKVSFPGQQLQGVWQQHPNQLGGSLVRSSDHRSAGHVRDSSGWGLSGIQGLKEELQDLKVF